jgi:hypothetical protein
MDRISQPGRDSLALEECADLQRDDERATTGLPPLEPGRAPDPGPTLDAVVAEVARLRRVLLKQGHAQELFQERLEQLVQALACSVETGTPAAPPRPAAGQGARGRGDADALPNPAQQRTLLELDQAVLRLLRLARGEEAPGGGPSDRESDPRTVQEGLGLLQIRVRNHQRSFGLEPIPAVGLPFDDRLHQAAAVCRRSDLPDGQVVEELLPGYRLRGKVMRTALVVVNRRP